MSFWASEQRGMVQATLASLTNTIPSMKGQDPDDELKKTLFWVLEDRTNV
jgi:hypothetical protein